MMITDENKFNQQASPVHQHTVQEW